MCPIAKHRCLARHFAARVTWMLSGLYLEREDITRYWLTIDGRTKDSRTEAICDGVGARLFDFGQRVQYSVFELCSWTPAQWNTLRCAVERRD